MEQSETDEGVQMDCLVIYWVFDHEILSVEDVFSITSELSTDTSAQVDIVGNAAFTCQWQLLRASVCSNLGPSPFVFSYEICYQVLITVRPCTIFTDI